MRRKGLQERLGQAPDLPENASAKVKMGHKLETDEGKAICPLRKSAAEPVCGIIKGAIGLDRFMLRGFP
jgi:hypothetical protein